MGKSINRSVWIRVACALVAVVLYSVMITVNIIRMDRAQTASEQAVELLERCHQAETAHYKWASNLSSALYAGKEFTGATTPDTCVLGQWIYGEAGTDDSSILALRAEMEPLHKQLHESAATALETLKTSPVAARLYYQNEIQTTLTTLVGKLDQVLSQLDAAKAESQKTVDSTIVIMHGTSIVGLAVALISMISLIIYVINHVVKPIIQISERCQPLHEGRLDLNLGIKAQNELGALADNLETSMARVDGYVDDINRIMGCFSQGDFDVHTSKPFIGDFQSIEESIASFTENISQAFVSIREAERQVSGHAESMSDGAQSLAQGATEQASAVQQLQATLEELRRNAEVNVATAGEALRNSKLTSEQVEISSREMEQMVSAMEDITRSSQEIDKIIATIENIAFQTNLLALNAAVEAARAGAAGKGFAVVADEVRSLAGQSDQAAKATKELIEGAAAATRKGQSIVGSVSESLRRTAELVVLSDKGIGDITTAIEGEANAITQVAEGIGQISAVVQSNSASSEESAAVSSELFSQVRILEAQTNKFRLKGEKRGLQRRGLPM